MHILVDLHTSFIRQVVPTIILGRFLGKQVVLSYYRNQAEIDLEQVFWWMGPFLHLCHRIVVSNDSTANLFLKYGINTVVIPPSIDSQLLEPREITSVQPKILVSRSLEKRNNMTCIIEAFGLVKQKYPRAEMTIAGDGPERPKLEEMVMHKRLTGITFNGPVQSGQLSRLYTEADLYINVSSIDGLPVSLLEALAVGLPVITTGVGGIPSVITDRKNGLFVNPDDPAQLAGTIIKLVESPNLVKSLSEQARLSISSQSIPGIKERWRSLYHSLNRHYNRK